MDDGDVTRSDGLPTETTNHEDSTKGKNFIIDFFSPKNNK